MNNVYNIEQNCRDICNISNCNASVFTAYNLTKNFLSQLQGLDIESGAKEKNSVTYGIGDFDELNIPLWVFQSKEDG